MNKILVFFYALLFGIPIWSQTVEVTEFYYEGGLTTTPLKVMILDSIARPIWKVQILQEYDLITDYKYLPERNIEGEYYSIQYPDSLAEDGFLVRSMKNQKAVEETKYNEEAERIVFSEYKYENGQLISFSSLGKSEKKELNTKIEKKLSYDEQGRIQKEAVYLNERLVNLIEYTHKKDVVKIISKPIISNKSFQELYVFNEEGLLISYQRAWGVSEKGKFVPQDRIKKHFKYNRKGLLKTATYEAFQEQKLKPFLTITKAYEIAADKKFDQSLYPKVIEKTLQFTLEEAWNYKQYGW